MQNDFYILNKEKILKGEIISTNLQTGEKKILDPKLPHDFNKLPLPVRLENTFYEKLNTTLDLVIFGAGHVGKALGEIGALLDFSITYVDNRQELLNPQRLPFATKLITSEYSDISKIMFSKNSYFVIVTSGHLGDLEVLEQLINLEASYIGLMGSHKKIDKIMWLLKESGVSEDRLSFVHAPIGLNINAKTPWELAISILGEIIQIKNNTNSTKLSQEMLDYIFNPTQKYILAKITKKIASAPRELGATMIVTSTTSLGTIGGGKLEAIVIEKARELLEETKSSSTNALLTFGLNENKDNSLDMWCGGEVEIYFEIGGFTR